VAQAAAASDSNTTGARDGHALPKFEYIAAAAATTDRNGSHDLCKKNGVRARVHSWFWNNENPPTPCSCSSEHHHSTDPV